MKNISIGFIIGVIVMAFFYNYCDDNQTITIPEKILDLETKTEIANTSVSSSNLKPIIKEVPKWYKDTKTEKELKQQLSDQETRLKNYEEEIAHAVDYFQYQDSVTKAKLYAECNKLNSFSQTWDDSIKTLTINGIAQGKIKEITPYLKIKEQKVIVPVKEKKFSIAGGFGTDFNATMPVYTFGFGYKIYEIDYLKINSQDFGTVKVRFRF
jgi:hypothetical protein